MSSLRGRGRYSERRSREPQAGERQQQMAAARRQRGQRPVQQSDQETAELPVLEGVVVGPQTSIEFNADRTEKVLVDTLKSFRDKQGKEDAAAWIARGLLERDLFRAYQPSGPPPRHAAPVSLVETVRREPEWALPERREAPPVPV